MKKMIILTIALGVFYMGAKEYRKNTEVQKPKVFSTDVTIYALANLPHKTQIVKKALELREIPHKIVDLNIEDLPNHKLFNRLIEEEIIQGDKVFAFVDFRGALIKFDNIHKKLSNIKIRDHSNLNKNVILVYGPKSCGFTRHKIIQLKRKGYEYEFRDVNSPSYKSEFEAKILSTGIKKWQWPMLDIKGKYLTSPSMAEVDKYY